MRKVDRGEFCSGPDAYLDTPMGINYNATISAPHMHAYALVIII
jgi:protein-L-isoaspartate(D-aspartate) O-methyltransferase